MPPLFKIIMKAVIKNIKKTSAMASMAVAYQLQRDASYSGDPDDVFWVQGSVVNLVYNHKNGTLEVITNTLKTLSALNQYTGLSLTEKDLVQC